VSRFPRLPLAVALLSAVSFLHPQVLLAQSQGDHRYGKLLRPVPGPVHDAKRIDAVGKAVVNFKDLEFKQEHSGKPKPPVQALLFNEVEEIDEPDATPAQGPPEAPTSTQVTSPAPSLTFMGLDDIPMADSSFIIIPPDCGGAVGPTKVMSGLNNNYRIMNKSDGSVVSTVGTATFWAPSGETALLGLTDPRTLYDPYNNRWIVEMQTTTTGAGDILVGVSQTSDPSGSWFLYRFAAGATIDFPIVGFNKNWITVSINRYSNAGTFTRGITLVVNYPLARTGTGTGTLFNQAANTHFCSAPCATYSSTSDTMFVVTHLSSSGATYSLDTITGTAAAPVYTSGGSLTRPGGGWVQPGGTTGQQLPQSAPNSGASACGATPCLIEVQDSQIRSAPVYRGGFIYYTQTIGLPSSGQTHTAVQWTKLGAPGGSFIDGGRLDDATATATNGGKWYAFPHIAVNSLGDFLMGYSQFSSAQHPSAGYSVHLAGDAAGSLRDPLIYKTGEDYYHKTFTTTTGRNRWGDFSQAQVDPVDDKTLWTVQEYAKTRTGTDDGNTGSNSSRWSTYWASVGGAPPPPTVTIAAGPSQNEGNSGLTAFNFTVNLSATSTLPVTVNYQTSDGTATAGSDYQAATSSIIIAPGATSGPITVNVIGDTTVEPNETFNVGLTGATNGVVGSPSTSVGTILNDDTYTITASAGAHGSIAPSGAVSVVPGASQAFTITPDACYHVQDVLVDGSSVGAVTSFNFTSVAANHTIAASFAINTFTITASAGAGGSITPSGAVIVSCGSSQGFTIAPSAGNLIADVLVDGSSVGAVASFNFTNVTAAHTISTSFAPSSFTITASAGAGGTINPSGAVIVASGADQAFTITADPCDHILDVLVDGGSVGAVSTFTFPGVTGNHTIAASFAPNQRVSVGDVVAVEGNSGTTDFDFPVRLSGPCTTQVDVTWQTADSTATVSDNDYVADSTVVSFPPGATTGTITVHVNGDLSVEDTETFLVRLSPAVNAGIDDGVGVGTILNDDGLTAVEALPLHELSFAVQGSNPAGDGVSFRIGLPAPTRAEVSVYDIMGRRVAQPLSEFLPAGYHVARWNVHRGAGTAGSGVYFVRFSAQGKTLIRKFVLLR
jgi:hypothetical protein